MPNVTEHGKGWSSEETADGWTGQRVFDVVAGDAVEAQARLLSEKSVQRGSSFIDPYGNLVDSRSYCLRLTHRAKTPTPLGGDGLWELTAHYGPPSQDPAGVSSGREPQRGGDPVYLWSRGESYLPLERDLAGNAVNNSKGEPYSNVQKLVPHQLLTIKWYAETVNLSSIFSYAATVNNAAWSFKGGTVSVAKGLALCHGIDPLFEEGWIKLTANFEFRPSWETWEPYVLVDYTEIDGARAYLDGAGNPVSLLPGAEPYTNEFTIYTGKDFNALGL